MTPIIANFLAWAVGFIMGMGVATLIHAAAMNDAGRDL